MFHRAAATSAALLAPFAIALGVPVLTGAGGVPAAFAGADNGSPSDDLSDENLPEDGVQQTPPPAPVPPPVTPPVTPPAPTPVLPELPPKPQDTLENDSPGSSGNSHDSNGGSGNNSAGGEGNVSSGTSHQTTQPQRLSVAQSNTATVSDTGAIPQGGVQAGGGGTAPSLNDASSSEGALGAAAGLVLLVTGSGLVLRRRHGATAR